MNGLKKAFVYIFISCIIIPNVLFLMGVDFYSDENRNLDEKPEFSIENICEYPDEYTSYYEDNMPFKDILVKCNAYLNLQVFHTSSEKSVICGKDGWLFYNSKYKENTDVLEDYINSTTISEQELEKCKNILLNMKEACEEEGAKFIFMVGPNKMTIYGDMYMPDNYYPYSKVTKADILVDYLRENTDIEIVYPKESLMYYRDDFQLYYKLDSHWNSLGGYIAYRELYETMFGEELPKIEDITYSSDEIGSGDLSRMLNVEGLKDIEYNVNYAPDIISTREYTEDGFYSTSDNLNGKKILMFRDSYVTAIENYVTKDFESAYLKWVPEFDQNVVREEQPDVVVYEMVERSIPNLSSIQHVFISGLVEDESYVKTEIPMYTDEQIAGWCVTEQDNNVLKVNGFGFVVGCDSSQTKANLLLIGDTTSYRAAINLGYRSDVVEAYNMDDSIGYSGVDVNLNIENVQSGQYDAYIVMENNGEKYFWNLDYSVNK